MMASETNNYKLLPYKKEFQSSIAIQNAFVGSRCLLTYQRDILSQGKFSVLSPFTGERIYSLSSVMLTGGTIAYAFQGPSPFWIVASALRFGYPLTHTIIHTVDRIITIPKAKEEVAEQELSTIRRIESSRCQETEANQSDCPAIVIGHPNFAHHLWNELGGLHEWLGIRESIGKKYRIFTLFEPLGNLKTLFSGLNLIPISRETPKALEGYRGMLTRIGSTRIPESLRLHLLKYLGESEGIPPAISARVARSSPVFWLNVRPPSSDRACQNEVEFLHALGTALLTRFSQSILIFDGLSLPVDFEDSNRSPKLKSYMIARQKQCDQDIAQIVSLVTRSIGEVAESRFINVSGWRLDHALSLAANTDFYVSHAGTLQHKVGWIHNKPGFIHSCKAILHPAARVWYADQVEHGIVPFVIDEENVQEVEVPGNKKLPVRNHSYVIKNVPAVVDRIIGLFCSLPKNSS